MQKYRVGNKTFSARMDADSGIVHSPERDQKELKMPLPQYGRIAFHMTPNVYVNTTKMAKLVRV